MVDTNGDADNEMLYEHWNQVKADAANRMNLAHALQNQSSELTNVAKAAKLAAVKAGTGHNPSSCSTCQAYAGLPPVAE
jgi:hypothetical protein